MPRIICEYYSKPLLAPMSMVGKQARCPSCKRAIRVMPSQLASLDKPAAVDFSDDLFMAAR